MSERTHEAVEDFRARARSFIRANLAPASSTPTLASARSAISGRATSRPELAAVAQGNGKSSACSLTPIWPVSAFPPSTAARDSTPEHQRTLNDELYQAMNIRPDCRPRPFPPVPPYCSTSGPRPKKKRHIHRHPEG